MLLIEFSFTLSVLQNALLFLLKNPGQNLVESVEFLLSSKCDVNQQDGDGLVS